MSSISAAVALVVASVVLVAPERAFACSCAVPAGLSEKELARQAFAGSNAVFAGEAVKIDLPPSMTSSLDPQKVTFRASEWWKGSGDEIVDVQTAVSEASCGYPFSEGARYLVFASKTRASDGELEVDLCGSTKPLPQAETTLATLGPGGAPTGPPPTGNRLPDTSGMPPGGFDPDRSLLLASVVALVLAIATVRSACRGRPRR